MAEKKVLRAEEFWTKVAEDVATFVDGTDQASLFLAGLTAEQNEPTHEV